MSLVDQYREMHLKGHFAGYSLKAHTEDIRQLVQLTRAKSLLDYGCGKGHQYSLSKMHRVWGGIMPTLYDPGVEQLSTKPSAKFDGVICTDVLEHIPEGEVEETLREIFSYATKFVYLSICTRPAKKTLPDGRNAHVTIKEPAWWAGKIHAASDGLGPDVVIEAIYTE